MRVSVAKAAKQKRRQSKHKGIHKLLKEGRRQAVRHGRKIVLERKL